MGYYLYIPQNRLAHHEVFNRQIGQKPSQHLLSFAKHAKSMTLSVLETSLPMQRSHDTLALCHRAFRVFVQQGARDQK